MGKVKNDNYYVTYGWMVNELGLRGNELQIFALIYGFSQSNKQFNGSISYLAEWIGGRRATAQAVLDRLVKKGLITKETNSSGTPNVYKINVNLYGNRTPTCTETVHPLYGNRTPTCTETVHNNYINNNIDNNIYSTTTIETTIKKYKSEITGRITCSPLEIDKLTKLFAEYGEKLNEAIEIAVMRNKKSLSYIEGVLKNGGYTNGSKRTEARTSRPSRVFKNRKVETIEDAEAKFRNETSGWD